MSWLDDNFDDHLAEDYESGWSNDKKECYDIIDELESASQDDDFNRKILLIKLKELRDKIEEIGVA